MGRSISIDWRSNGSASQQAEVIADCITERADADVGDVGCSIEKRTPQIGGRYSARITLPNDQRGTCKPILLAVRLVDLHRTLYAQSDASRKAMRRLRTTGDTESSVRAGPPTIPQNRALQPRRPNHRYILTHLNISFSRSLRAATRRHTIQQPCCIHRLEHIAAATRGKCSSH